MKKILWIDDDYYIIKDLVRPLMKAGIIFENATDYPSFHEKFHSEKYDLFIVDLILPQQNIDKKTDQEELFGYTGLKIAAEIAQKNLPIVILSIVSDPEIRTNLNKLGSVIKIIDKGSVLPSDFKKIILDIFKSLKI